MPSDDHTMPTVLAAPPVLANGSLGMELALVKLKDAGAASGGAAPKGVIWSPNVTASALVPAASLRVTGMVNVEPGEDEAEPTVRVLGDAAMITVESPAVAVGEP